MSNNDEYRSSISLVIQLFGEKVKKHFEPLLLNQTIESRNAIWVKNYIETRIKINGEEYPMYYRRARLEEKEEEQEITNEDEYTISEFFDEKVKQQKIVRIDLYDNYDQELFLSCFLENEAIVEIPLGFIAEHDEFYNFLEEILTTEEIESYHIFRAIDIASLLEKKETFESRSRIYKRILNALNLESKFEYEFSDFYKVEKIEKLIKADKIDVVKTLAAVERVIYE